MGPRPRYGRGFSLLEMMVVLTVLALAAGAVSLRIGVGSDQMTAREAARHVAAALTEARADALRSGRPTTLQASSGQNTLTVAGVGTRLDGARITRAAKIRFRPEGGGDGGPVLLSRGEITFAISVDPFTGAVRISRVGPGT